MTAISANAFDSHSTEGVNSILSRIDATAYLGALLAEWRRALAAGSAYEDLARLSDRQLEDIGLTRQDLPSIIHRQHYGS
jgi:uncharacterized protein YjiS (DUF1127 family)